MAGGEIEIVGVTKIFNHSTVVDDISLDMPAGEFFTIVGPSGCGKTTTLRMLAGFEQPTHGRIILDGQDMQGTPPYRRQVNTVFQNYALFPHYNVFDNVAYGLRRAKCQKQEIKQRVGDALDLVQLNKLAGRKPNHLSGGQQQRVALARALVLNPKVLLLDEPLGALDAKLRKQLQIDLKALQQRLEITFVYVTHDQEEALTMSDRIAIMNNGRLEQVGTARNVYEDPATEFAADFLGTTNLIDANAAGKKNGSCELDIDGARFFARRGILDVQGSVRCVIRPERIRIEPSSTEGENRLYGTVETLVFLGNSIQVIVKLKSGQTIRVFVQIADDSMLYEEGQDIAVFLPPNALRVLRPTEQHGEEK